MPVSDGDVIQVVVNQTMVNGDIAKNIFVWLVDKVSIGSWSDAEIGTFCKAAVELIWAGIKADLTNGMSFDTIDVYKRVGTIWDYLTTSAIAITATDAGDSLPPGVAMLATAYTALNRTFGRKFLYGVVELNTIDGALTAGMLTTLAAWALEYITAYSGGTMGPLDFLVPGVWSTVSAAFVPFGEVAVVKDTLSYQRRRKTGVGV